MTNNPYRLSWIPGLAGHAGPAYAALAGAMEKDIRSGRLPAGTRLPPQRLLAYTLGLNLGTVHKAYRLAMKRGLIAGEVGRGSFVRDAAAGRASWPNESPYDRAIDFCDNYPCPIKKPGLIEKELGALAQNPAFGTFLQYQQNSAYPAHRAAGASWLGRFGVEAAPERVILASGSLHAGFVCLMTLCQAGDLLLTEAYASQAIRSVARRLKLRIKGVRMDRHGILPEHLEALLKKEKAAAAYFVPTLHNPTATLLPVERRREVAALLTKYGVPLIEDDIFAPLLDAPPRPISGYMPDLGFYSVGLSKALAPAFRLAFLKVPERFYEDVLDSLRVTTWMASPLLAEVACRLIASGKAERLIAEQKAEIAQRQKLARAALRGFGFLGHPEALHAWLKLPEPWRAEDFKNALAGQEILALPSDAFAVNREETGHAVRLCLGTPPTRAKVAEGLKIVREVLGS